MYSLGELASADPVSHSCFELAFVVPIEGKTNFGRLRVGYELVTKKRNQVTLGQE